MGEVKTHANKGADEYNATFLEAWKNVLQGYRDGEIRPLSERGRHEKPPACKFVA